MVTGSCQLHIHVTLVYLTLRFLSKALLTELFEERQHLMLKPMCFLVLAVAFDFALLLTCFCFAVSLQLLCFFCLSKPNQAYVVSTYFFSPLCQVLHLAVVAAAELAALELSQGAGREELCGAWRSFPVP
jgi:hypothetical protein